MMRSPEIDHSNLKLYSFFVIYTIRLVDELFILILVKRTSQYRIEIRLFLK